MNTEGLIAGFKSIQDNLNSDEIHALQKFTGLTDKGYLVESFFQELINCKVNKKPFYSSDNWKSLTKCEKEILVKKILQWYNILLLYYPDYQKRCILIPEDELRLEMVFKGKDLTGKDEYCAYILYLENVKTDKINEGASDELIEWINREIAHSRAQCGIQLTTYDNNDEDSTDSVYENSFVFPDEIIDILIEYHRKFNGRIFEEIRLDEFLRLFKETGECSILFKEELKGHFKYSISFVEKYHRLDSDFNKWFSKKLGGSYKNSKREPKKNSNITEEVKTFFQNRIKQYELKNSVRP